MVLNWKKKISRILIWPDVMQSKKALLSEVVFICTGSGRFPGTRGSSSHVGRLTTRVITAQPPRHQGTSEVEQHALCHELTIKKLHFQLPSTNIYFKVQKVDGCFLQLQSSCVVFRDASELRGGFSDWCGLLRRLLMKCPDRFSRVVSDDWTHFHVDQLCSLTFWKICDRDFLAAS